MLLKQLQLRRVLDRDDALLRRYVAGEDVEQSRLAGRCATRDENAQPAADGGTEELDHLGGRAANGEQVVRPKLVSREFADRHAGAVDRERRQHDVDARSVAQTRITHRRAFVDPPAHRADDPVDDLPQLTGVFEDYRAQVDPPAALDEDPVRVIDHDLGDRRILEESLQRPKAQNLVQKRIDEMAVVEPVERDARCLDVLLGQIRDSRSNSFAVGDVDLVCVPLYEQGMDGGFGRGERACQTC